MRLIEEGWRQIWLLAQHVLFGNGKRVPRAGTEYERDEALVGNSTLLFKQGNQISAHGVVCNCWPFVDLREQQLISDNIFHWGLSGEEIAERHEASDVLEKIVVGSRDITQYKIVGHQETKSNPLNV